jgi:hypothetical protein
MDAARTPGDWSYGNLTARYTSPSGQSLFTMTCDKAKGTVTLVRLGNVAAATPMRILTETATRLFDAKPAGSQTGGLVVILQARDSLLDAMALSRGRFAVETGGASTLYLPSWTEVSRVIEDCR